MSKETVAKKIQRKAARRDARRLPVADAPEVESAPPTPEPEEVAEVTDGAEPTE